MSRRSHGVVEFPPAVEAVLAADLGAGSKRALRRDSAALVAQLRARSRSTARGGVNALPPLAKDSSSDADGANAVPTRVPIPVYSAPVTCTDQVLPWPYCSPGIIELHAPTLPCHA